MADDADRPDRADLTDRPDLTDLTRRQLLGVAAGAVVATPLLSSATVSAVAAPGQRFFTQAEFALLDELTELIIPTDEHSPGARAAKVAAYLDRRVAEAFENEVRLRWRAGLKAIDAAAQKMHGRRFMACNEAERVAVLTKLAEREKAPKTADDTLTSPRPPDAAQPSCCPDFVGASRFFVELKQNTVRGYYTSEIGIHKEMQYKGNTMLEEFVGIDVSK